MKYLFTAIAFWALGYVIPSFPTSLQYVIVAILLLFLGVSVRYFIDTRVFANLFQEEEEKVR